MGIARRIGRGAARGHILSPCPCAMLSPVAHHHSVGARAADVLTLCPLLTASLGFKSDSLADQFTLTGTTGADGLHGEPCCHEFCFGCCSEVHLVKTTILWCGRNRFRSRAPALAILARLDAVALVLNTNPAGGVASVRAAPDDCIFSIGSSETVGMVDVGCPVTTPLVKVSEGCWLDGEGSGGHRWLSVLCVL